MGFDAKTLVFVFLVATLTTFAKGVPQVPCYFIFGDSLMDNGNNNDLPTEAKANYAPYGIDFPDGPTGRFSNGRNVADILAELLRFDNFIPPFATVKRDEIHRGVNYASGAAGIRDETAHHMGATISFNKQLSHHARIVLGLFDLIGNGSLARAKQHLHECIYTVALGNNDYINNYFLPQYYITSKIYTPEKYADVLVKKYSGQLSKLYRFGARKFGIFGAGYSGCTPAMMGRYNTDACVNEVNGAVVLFNAKLVSALGDLEKKLPGAKFIFLEPPLGYSSDFNVTDKPCCKVSNTSSKGQCAPNEIPCTARRNYVFWDGFHPTEAIALVDGARAYEALSPFYVLGTKVSLPTSEVGFKSDV